MRRRRSNPEADAFQRFKSTLESQSIPEPVRRSLRKAATAWLTASSWVSSLENHPEKYPAEKRTEWLRLWRKKLYTAKTEAESLAYGAGEKARKALFRFQDSVSEAQSSMERENPDEEPWFSTMGMRNWIILAGVGVAGYFVWKKWLSKKFQKTPTQVGAAAKPQALQTPPPAAPVPGWTYVKANQVSGTSTGNFIKKKQKGMNYAKILITKMDRGYPVREFVSTVNGWFTGNLVREGTVTWAEIKPV